jgi:large subunit ribosomal protein L21
MNNFAVIETGGKQYKVAPGEKIKVEKLNAKEGDSFKFDKVLLAVDGGKAEVGKPYLPGAGVEAKVIKQGRADKVVIFKYHSKTRFRKRKGHRQMFTELEITKV